MFKIGYMHSVLISKGRVQKNKAWDKNERLREGDRERKDGEIEVILTCQNAEQKEILRVSDDA